MHQPSCQSHAAKCKNSALFTYFFNPAHKNVSEEGIGRFSHFTALRLKRKWDNHSTWVKSRCPLTALCQAHTTLSCPRDRHPVTPGVGRPAAPTWNTPAASPGLMLPQLSPFRAPTHAGGPAATCPRFSPSQTRRPPSPGLPSRLTQRQPCLPGSHTSRCHGSKPAGCHTRLLSFPPLRFALGNDSSSCPPLSPRGVAARPDLPPARPGGCHIPPATQPRAHPRLPPPRRPPPPRGDPPEAGRLLPPPHPAERGAGIPRPRYPGRARSLPSELAPPPPPTLPPSAARSPLSPRRGTQPEARTPSRPPPPPPRCEGRKRVAAGP